MVSIVVFFIPFWFVVGQTTQSWMDGDMLFFVVYITLTVAALFLGLFLSIVFSQWIIKIMKVES